jgi:hypothetical protein
VACNKFWVSWPCILFSPYSRSRFSSAILDICRLWFCEGCTHLSGLFSFRPKTLVSNAERERRVRKSVCPHPVFAAQQSTQRQSAFGRCLATEKLACGFLWMVFPRDVLAFGFERVVFRMKKQRMFRLRIRCIPSDAFAVSYCIAFAFAAMCLLARKRFAFFVLAIWFQLRGFSFFSVYFDYMSWLSLLVILTHQWAHPWLTHYSCSYSLDIFVFFFDW